MSGALNVMGKQIIQEQSPADYSNRHADNPTAHTLRYESHKAKTKENTSHQKIGDSDPEQTPWQVGKIDVTQS